MSFRSIQRGRWHSYELDGQRIPSVTKLIGDGIPKPNLIGWAAKAAAEYAADHLDEISRLERDACVDVIANAHNRSRNTAAAKGTDIHRIAQQLVAGTTVEYPLELEGYVTAYLAFVDDWHPDVLAIETPVCSRRWRYGGRFDLAADLDGFRAIIDVKTGGSGVWPETCLQLAAYRHADTMLVDGTEQPMLDTNAGYALWLVDDGSYELLPVESGDEIFHVFLHCAHVAAFAGRAKDDLIGLPLERPTQLQLEVVS